MSGARRRRTSRATRTACFAPRAPSPSERARDGERCEDVRRAWGARRSCDLAAFGIDVHTREELRPIEGWAALVAVVFCLGHAVGRGLRALDLSANPPVSDAQRRAVWSRGVL